MSHCSRGRHVLSPRDERTLVQINPRTTAKDHRKMQEETDAETSTSTVK